MPAAYQGTQFRVSGDPVLNLSPPPGVSAAQQRNELDLLNELNEQHRQATPDDTELAARIRAGDFDDRYAEVRDAVWASVRDKLAVANPRYLDD